MRQRKSCRLQGYDYSQQGVYFITICTKNRAYLFGDVLDGKMVLSECGEVVEQIILEWSPVGNGLAPFRSNEIDATNGDGTGQARSLRGKVLHYVIMPNHVHLLIQLPPSGNHDIPEILRKMKSKSATLYLKICKENDIMMGKIWQKGYHDHIVRNQDDYNRIYEYIQNNPLQWELDCHNPLSEKYEKWDV